MPAVRAYLLEFAVGQVAETCAYWCLLVPAVVRVSVQLPEQLMLSPARPTWPCAGTCVRCECRLEVACNRHLQAGIRSLCPCS